MPVLPSHEVSRDELEQFVRTHPPSSEDERMGAKMEWEVKPGDLYRTFFARVPFLLNLIVPKELQPTAHAFLPSILEEGDRDRIAILNDWLYDHSCRSLDDVRMVFGFDN